jgi:hypothetical protein
VLFSGGFILRVSPSCLPAVVLGEEALSAASPALSPRRRGASVRVGPHALSRVRARARAHRPADPTRPTRAACTTHRTARAGVGVTAAQPRSRDLLPALSLSLEPFLPSHLYLDPVVFPELDRSPFPRRRRSPPMIRTISLAAEKQKQTTA